MKFKFALTGESTEAGTLTVGEDGGIIATSGNPKAEQLIGVYPTTLVGTMGRQGDDVYIDSSTRPVPLSDPDYRWRLDNLLTLVGLDLLQ